MPEIALPSSMVRTTANEWSQPSWELYFAGNDIMASKLKFNSKKWLRCVMWSCSDPRLLKWHHIQQCVTPPPRNNYFCLFTNHLKNIRLLLVTLQMRSLTMSGGLVIFICSMICYFFSFDYCIECIPFSFFLFVTFQWDKFINAEI